MRRVILFVALMAPFFGCGKPFEQPAKPVATGGPVSVSINAQYIGQDEDQNPTQNPTPTPTQPLKPKAVVRTQAQLKFLDEVKKLGWMEEFLVDPRENIIKLMLLEKKDPSNELLKKTRALLLSAPMSVELELGYETKFTPEEFLELKDIDSLRELILLNKHITPAWLKSIAELGKLNTLVINNDNLCLGSA